MAGLLALLLRAEARAWELTPELILSCLWILEAVDSAVRPRRRQPLLVSCLVEKAHGKPVSRVKKGLHCTSLSSQLRAHRPRVCSEN